MGLEYRECPFGGLSYLFLRHDSKKVSGAMGKQGQRAKGFRYGLLAVNSRHSPISSLYSVVKHRHNLKYLASLIDQTLSLAHIHFCQ